MKKVHIGVLICLAGAMLGCGQKGPLVMPDAPKHKRDILAPAAAPAGPTTTSASPTTVPAPAAAPPAAPDSVAPKPASDDATTAPTAGAGTGVPLPTDSTARP